VSARSLRLPHKEGRRALKVEVPGAGVQKAGAFGLVLTINSKRNRILYTHLEGVRKVCVCLRRCGLESTGLRV